MEDILPGGGPPTGNYGTTGTEVMQGETHTRCFKIGVYVVDTKESGTAQWRAEK